MRSIPYTARMERICRRLTCVRAAQPWCSFENPGVVSFRDGPFFRRSTYRRACRAVRSSFFDVSSKVRAASGRRFRHPRHVIQPHHRTRPNARERRQAVGAGVDRSSSSRAGWICFDPQRLGSAAGVRHIRHSSRAGSTRFAKGCHVGAYQLLTFSSFAFSVDRSGLGSGAGRCAL